MTPIGIQVSRSKVSVEGQAYSLYVWEGGISVLQKAIFYLDMNHPGRPSVSLPRNLKLKWTNKYIIFPKFSRVLARWMSRLISFVLAYSSCDSREESENYKMKNSCPQFYSIPLPPLTGLAL